MILVTGAAGHLGNVLVRELVARHEKVRALVLPGENLTPLEDLDVEVFEGNILDFPRMLEACQGIELVFHLASLVAITEDKIDLMHKVNVEGTRNVIDASRQSGVRRLVYTSSIHALERPKSDVTIDEKLRFDPHNPAGPYDRTKAEATLLVLQAAQQGLDAVVVCPTGVIGPSDFKRSELGEMMLSWMKRSFLSVQGKFDCGCADVALGHIWLQKKAKAGKPTCSRVNNCKSAQCAALYSRRLALIPRKLNSRLGSRLLSLLWLNSSTKSRAPNPNLRVIPLKPCAVIPRFPLAKHSANWVTNPAGFTIQSRKLWTGGKQMSTRLSLPCGRKRKNPERNKIFKSRFCRLFLLSPSDNNQITTRAEVKFLALHVPIETQIDKTSLCKRSLQFSMQNWEKSSGSHRAFPGASGLSGQRQDVKLNQTLWLEIIKAEKDPFLFPCTVSLWFHKAVFSAHDCVKIALLQ